MKGWFVAIAAGLTLAAGSPHTGHAAAESWFEIRSANFTVLANANDGPTRTVLWQLEQIRNVAKTLWPWMKVDLPKPLMIIAAKDEQSMKRLVPEYWEQKGGVRPTSVWVSGPDQHYIAIRADLRSPDGVTVNPHTSAYFSYANLTLASSFAGELPLWLSRGLAGVISNTLVRQDDVVLGAVIPWHLERLRERHRPLRQMFAVTRQSPEFSRDQELRAFDAQSWAFVHFLMFGEGGKNAPRLNTFVTMLAGAQPPDAAFAAALGSIDDYDRAFSNYVNRSVFTGIRIKVDVGIDRERFPARSLSVVDSALARASFQAAMGRTENARALVAEATKLDAQAAGASVVEALLLEREGKIEESRGAYDKAVSLGTTNPYALYRWAVLAWRGADDATLERVEKNLTRAVEVSPLFASAHATLAEVRAELKRPQLTIVTHMHKAVQLEPSDPWHRISAARVYARLGIIDEARKAAESAVALAGDDTNARTEAERILMTLKGR
jgi:tetratricopeptide (TPR) repeat protein